MTAVHTTLEALSGEYKRTGQRYIRQADAKLDRGDSLKASEKAWDAASEYIKSLATLRGVPHESHREIRIAVNHIVNETGLRQVSPLFAVAESLHANFYEAWMPEEEIDDGIESVKRRSTFPKTYLRPWETPLFDREERACSYGIAVTTSS